MSRRRIVPELNQELPQSPLLPFGHRFAGTDRPVVTPWGEVLPPKSFSKAQLKLLGGFAAGVAPLGIDLDSPVVILGRYLHPKLTFGPEFGCWKLPLKADHDIDPQGKPRARYPTISIKKLGYEGQLAHRATVETFAGATLNGRHTHVDHRCRDHSCCNPDHLRPVTALENNVLGVDARRHIEQPPLIHLPPGDQLTFAELSIILTGLSHDIPPTA